MGKVFVHRRINPTKGRIELPDAPPLAHVPAEERAIMRALIKEQREAALAKRAATRPCETKGNRPPTPSVTFFFVPELVQAFAYFSSSTLRKVEYRNTGYRDGPSPINAIIASAPWLKRFKQREINFCAGCGVETTTSVRGMVPHQIQAVGPIDGPYKISSLCYDCMKDERHGKVTYIGSALIVYIE